MLRQERHDPAFIATAILAIALIAVLILHLFLALLAGLAAFALHTALLGWVSRRVPAKWRQTVAMLLFWLALALIVSGIVEAFEQFGVGSPGESMARLSDLLATSLDRLRSMVPPWLAAHLPDSITVLREQASAWLRTHASDVRLWGAETLRALAHMLVGLVIGLLASVQSAGQQEEAAPFLQAWRKGLNRLVQAFTNVMGAQIRIAGINTAFTAVYLLIVAPLAFQQVPLAKTLVVLTFVVGLLPVIGNLLSNSAIVLASLMASPSLAIVSLLYLVGIHKLEYFLNARLVGGRIHAKTYELLAAMLLLEAIFGLKGVVAAPIYYAWLMGVLRDENWLQADVGAERTTP